MNLSNRVIVFVIVFVVLSAVLAYFASTVTMSQSEAQSINSQVRGIEPTTLGIFTNNFRIALVEFIPVFGPAFGVYTSYSTGVAITAIAQANPQSHLTGFESFLLLLLTPIYWLEFFSYSVAVEESIAVLVSIKNRDFLNMEWKWLVASILVVGAVLLISANLEATLVGALK